MTEEACKETPGGVVGCEINFYRSVQQVKEREFHWSILPVKFCRQLRHDLINKQTKKQTNKQSSPPSTILTPSSSLNIPAVLFFIFIF